LSANASATGSPDNTIFSLPGPSTCINCAGEPARTASIRAVTASSRVLYRFCAKALFAIVRNAVATAKHANQDGNEGKEKARENDGGLIMISWVI
jgi:hypothetical protein